MSDAARLLANVIRLQTSNMEEAVVLVSEALRELVGQGMSAPEAPVVPMAGKGKVREGAEKRGVAEKVERTVFARPNQFCHCEQCGKDVFRIDKDVYDNMPREEFIAAFTPLVTETRISPDDKFQNVDGCMMTNCPVCAGEMSLVLWGRKPVLGKGFSGGEGVTTLSEEDIRSL
jgi:hypothetical protein